MCVLILCCVIFNTYSGIGHMLESLNTRKSDGIKLVMSAQVSKYVWRMVFSLRSGHRFSTFSMKFQFLIKDVSAGQLPSWPCGASETLFEMPKRLEIGNIFPKKRWGGRN